MVLLNEEVVRDTTTKMLCTTDPATEAQLISEFNQIKDIYKRQSQWYPFTSTLYPGNGVHLGAIFRFPRPAERFGFDRVPLATANWVAANVAYNPKTFLLGYSALGGHYAPIR